MVDNFEQIKKLLKFDSEEEFYFVQILQRTKENPNLGKNNNLIRTYNVYSLEYLDKKNQRYSEITNILYNCEPINTVKIITKIETKNGFHLISRPFNSQKFGEWLPTIQIHKNNPTILFIP